MTREQQKLIEDVLIERLKAYENNDTYAFIELNDRLAELYLEFDNDNN